MIKKPKLSCLENLRVVGGGGVGWRKLTGGGKRGGGKRDSQGGEKPRNVS